MMLPHDHHHNRRREAPTVAAGQVVQLFSRPRAPRRASYNLLAAAAAGAERACACR